MAQAIKKGTFVSNQSLVSSLLAMFATRMATEMISQIRDGYGSEKLGGQVAMQCAAAAQWRLLSCQKLGASNYY
jgi:hypothetical protein